MKKLLALLLVLAMVFSMMAMLTACGEDEDDDDEKTSDEDDEDDDDKKDKDDEDKDDDKDKDDDDDDDVELTLVGEWKGTLDLAEAINEAIADQMGADGREYMSLESFEIEVYFEFTEDGEYTFTIDEDSVEEALETALDHWVDGFQAAAEDAGEDYDEMVDIIESEMGMTVREYVWENMVDMIPDIDNVSGDYKLDGDKLYLDGDGAYVTVILTKKSVTFDEYSEDDYYFESVFCGVTFTRY